jgi:hypothetical protein
VFLNEIKTWYFTAVLLFFLCVFLSIPLSTENSKAFSKKKILMDDIVLNLGDESGVAAKINAKTEKTPVEWLQLYLSCAKITLILLIKENANEKTYYCSFHVFGIRFCSVGLRDGYG